MPSHPGSEIPLIAGRPVLDLVNTVSWRGDRTRADDHLQDASDALTWAGRAGVLSPPELEQLRPRLTVEPDAGAGMVRSLRRLRTVVAEAVLNPTPDALSAAQDVIRDALDHSSLRAETAPTGHGPAARPYRWEVTDLDEHTVHRRLALDLDALLTSATGRIGVCADEACQWVFLDTSRAHNRQWCSSADCGNRHRVQRHYQRRHPRTGPASSDRNDKTVGGRL